MVCLWPGLPQLWIRGAWSGLALALGFTALVNVLLLASLVWTQWLPLGFLIVGWAAVGMLWLLSTIASMGWLGASTRQASADDGEELFREAQAHYLKGNWYEAETLLNQRLSRNGRDIDALLMLATLKRHTGRLDEALGQLERLERLEHAIKWHQEIARERMLIARARAEQAAEEEETASRSSKAGGKPATAQASATTQLTEAA